MVARIVLVFVASLTLAAAISSCISQPSASLLAADISKLGFIPGKPVTMPPGFKAEGSDMGEIAGYDFRNGFYLVDNNDLLTCASIISPQSLMPGGVRPGMTKEQSEAMKKKSAKDVQAFRKGKNTVGDRIADKEKSSIGFITWRNKDLFSLSPDELFSTYGPPSRPIEKPTNDTIQLGEGVAPYTYSFRMAEYIYQVGPDEYWAVRISLSKFVGRPEIVDSMTMIGFEPSEMQPLSDYKAYPWPGLYPAPTTK
jgi:hypothetical protein